MYIYMYIYICVYVYISTYTHIYIGLTRGALSDAGCWAHRGSCASSRV